MLAVGNQAPWRRRSVLQVELWRLNIQPLKKWPAAQPGRMMRISRDGGGRGRGEFIPHKAPITPANRIDDASIVLNKYGGLCRKVSMVVVIPGLSAGERTV